MVYHGQHSVRHVCFRAINTDFLGFMEYIVVLMFISFVADSKQLHTNVHFKVQGTYLATIVRKLQLLCEVKYQMTACSVFFGCVD